MTRWLACALPILVSACSPSATSAGAQTPVAQSSPACGVQKDGARTTTTCSRERVIQGVDVKLTVESVEQAAAAGSAQPVSTTTETRFYANGQLVVDWVHESVAPTGGQTVPTLKDTYTYGPAVHGVHSVVLIETGGMVSGTIDGRALAPYKATSRPPVPTLADGTAVPATSIDASAQAAMREFVSQAFARTSQ